MGRGGPWGGDGRLFEVGANSRLGAYSNKFVFIYKEKYTKRYATRAELLFC